MKKALILTGFDPLTHTGGIEAFTKTLLRLFESMHIQGDLLCASDFGNTFNLHHEFSGRVYAAGRSLLSLDTGEYECIVSNGYYGGGYFPKTVKTFTIFHSTHAGYADAIKGCIPHSTYLEIRNIVGDVLERSAASGAKIIAVSELVKTELQEYYGLQDIDVIPDPVDTDVFSPTLGKEEAREKYGIHRSRRVGLFVGRWEISKGKDIAERIMADMRDLFWVIVTASGGESPPPRGENILTLSGLNRSEMAEIYRLSDFMLSPSRYEGFGLAAAEAMASGIPVIGTPVGFLGEICGERPFSAVSVSADPRDEGATTLAMKESIQRLFSDSELYREISEKGRTFISNNYGFVHWQERMKKALCLN
ncbi:MAG TPA: glycosyltransferase family 4 protein [Thermodesulfovibrionales bacterium]|nr:glycosyltransferase family 4 protein [Thermodesulfovibrionales bacterium]